MSSGSGSGLRVPGLRVPVTALPSLVLDRSSPWLLCAATDCSCQGAKGLPSLLCTPQHPAAGRRPPWRRAVGVQRVRVHIVGRSRGYVWAGDGRKTKLKFKLLPKSATRNAIEAKSFARPLNRLSRTGKVIVWILGSRMQLRQNISPGP